MVEVEYEKEDGGRECTKWSDEWESVAMDNPEWKLLELFLLGFVVGLFFYLFGNHKLFLGILKKKKKTITKQTNVKHLHNCPILSIFMFVFFYFLFYENKIIKT